MADIMYKKDNEYVKLTASDLGAAGAEELDNYLPLTGGTLSGDFMILRENSVVAVGDLGLTTVVAITNTANAAQLNIESPNSTFNIRDTKSHTGLKVQVAGNGDTEISTIPSSGIIKSNKIITFSNEDGAVKSIGSPGSFRKALGIAETGDFLPLTGGELSGDLSVVSNDINIVGGWTKGFNLKSDTTDIMNGIEGYDTPSINFIDNSTYPYKNGFTYGRIYVGYSHNKDNASSLMYFTSSIINPDDDNVGYDNEFIIGINKNGEAFYNLSHPPKLRKELGLGDTSGPVPVANGGTGTSDKAIAANNLMVMSLGGGVAIPANADLNDYKTPGNYYNKDTAEAKTIKNKPKTQSGTVVSYPQFFVKVYQYFDDNYYVWQELHYVSDVSRIYHRRWTGTSWTTWCEYSSVEVGTM